MRCYSRRVPANSTEEQRRGPGGYSCRERGLAVHPFPARPAGFEGSTDESLVSPTAKAVAPLVA